MNTTFSHVPPGFRFHPTDEELVDYYLRKKVTSRRIDLDVIKDIDLYKIEPWDLQELCSLGTEEQNEWYFFSHKDKKYPTGTRTNRATAAGFWKATGRDKAIYSKHDLIGMRKTLVFYKGRAPNGQKSDWIMHEYRLETDENGTPQEEGWVVCRAFKKRMTSVRKVCEHESPIWYDDQVSFMSEMDSPKQQQQSSHHHHHPHSNLNTYHYHPYSCKKELDFQYQILQLEQQQHQQFLQLPLLESPKLVQSSIPLYEQNIHQAENSLCNDQAADQVTDWRVLDKFVASQLSQEDVISKESDNNNSNNNAAFQTAEPSSLFSIHLNKQEMAPENALTSSSGCQIDMWK